MVKFHSPSTAETLCTSTRFRQLAFRLLLPIQQTRDDYENEEEVNVMSTHEEVHQCPQCVLGRGRSSEFERVLEEENDTGKVWYFIQELLELCD